MHKPPPHAVPDTARLKRAGVIGLVVVVLVVGIGLTSRLLATQDLKSWTAAQAVPTVSVLHPVSEGNRRTVSLPGSVEAWTQAQVFARTNGYLKGWYADIGTPVKAGQLLAEIDTPDVDQQVQAAVANLATAEASLQLADSTAKRWEKLLAQEAVSRQAAEEKQSDLAVKRAQVSQARAQVEGLRTLQGFRHLTAPFDGVVTSRATDVGALIVSGNAAARPLFTVSDTKKMRIYVRVPQSYAADIEEGMTASLTMPEYPDRTFQAKLLNTAGAVTNGSGTMLVQLVTDNADGLLRPGSYAQVTFSLPGSGSAVHLPASALMFRQAGMVIATVDAEGRVSIRPVKVAQDFGAQVELEASGLTASDQVIDSPPEALADGDKVHVLQPTADQAAR